MARATVFEPDDLIRAIGDPHQVREDLRIFGDNSRGFAAAYEEILREYPQCWVAFYDGAVRAHGSILEDVLKAIDDAGWSRQHVCVGYMDPEPSTLIL